MTYLFQPVMKRLALLLLATNLAHAQPAAVLGKAGDIEITGSEIREIVAGLEADQQAAGVDVLKAMFEEEAAPTGFTEAFDPNAEPGTIVSDDAEAPAEAPAADEAQA